MQLGVYFLYKTQKVVFYCPVEGSGVSIGGEVTLKHKSHLVPGLTRLLTKLITSRVMKHSGFLFTVCWRAEGWPHVPLHTLPTQQNFHWAGDCSSHLSQCKLGLTGPFVKNHCKLNTRCWKPNLLLLEKKKLSSQVNWSLQIFELYTGKAHWLHTSRIKIPIIAC